MQQHQLATVLLSLLGLSLALSEHHHHNLPLHCNKWKNSCDKHQAHCSSDTKPEQEAVLPASCCALLPEDSSQTPPDSGHYTLRGKNSFSQVEAWCDMETSGGGWQTIVRRVSESQDIFNTKLFHEYEDGFGSLDGSFWYGLNAMRLLTSQETYEMRVDMYREVEQNETSAHAHYSSFEVSGANYTLKLGSFNGSEPNLIDNLVQFNNQQFVARRFPGDLEYNCVNTYKAAGWWYVPGNCLAGDGQTIGTVLTRGFQDLEWYKGKGVDSEETKFQKYEMKIRPTSCKL